MRNRLDMIAKLSETMEKNLSAHPNMVKDWSDVLRFLTSASDDFIRNNRANILDIIAGNTLTKK
jgi:hypothetical protein